MTRKVPEGLAEAWDSARSSAVEALPGLLPDSAERITVSITDLDADGGLSASVQLPCPNDDRGDIEAALSLAGVDNVVWVPEPKKEEK